MARIGLYFGSFNPIHNGHVAVAHTVLENVKKPLDQVWLVPSPQNPFKDIESLAPFNNRSEMTNLAICTFDHIYVCDIEKDVPPPNYTWDTLETLKEFYPNHTFYIIIGSDNYHRLEEWKNYDKIIAGYDFFIVMRNGEDFSHVENGKFTCLPQVLTISSTEIREKIQSGESLYGLVSPVVENYIRERNLYIKK